MKNEIKKRLLWRILKIMYNNCDVVVVPSYLSAKKVKAHNIPCVFIPHGLDLEIFRRKLHYTKTNKILSVSRLGNEKNLDVLIRAFSIVVKQHPQAKLTIVGDGPARNALESLAKKLGIRNKVKFTGMLDRKNFQKLYDSHDFFANASCSETFGMVTLEAMAGGLPVAGVNTQGTADLIRRGKNGYLAESSDVDNFAKVMIKLMDKSQTELKKMGGFSYKRAQLYSVKKSLNGYIKQYELLRRKRLG